MPGFSKRKRSTHNSVATLSSSGSGHVFSSVLDWPKQRKPTTCCHCVLHERGPNAATILSPLCLCSKIQHDPYNDGSSKQACYTSAASPYIALGSSQQLFPATMAAPADCDTRSKVEYYMTAHPLPIYAVTLGRPVPIVDPNPLPPCTQERVACPFYTDDSRCELLPDDQHEAASDAGVPNSAYSTCTSCQDQLKRMLDASSNLLDPTPGEERLFRGSPMHAPNPAAFVGGAPTGYVGGCHYLGRLCDDCKHDEVAEYYRRLGDELGSASRNPAIRDRAKERAASTCKCEEDLALASCYGHRWKILDEIEAERLQNVQWLRFLRFNVGGNRAELLQAGDHRLNVIWNTRATTPSENLACRCGRDIARPIGHPVRNLRNTPRPVAMCLGCSGVKVDFQYVENHYTPPGRPTPSRHNLRLPAPAVAPAVKEANLWKLRRPTM